jgi:hypothetical protein
MVRAVLATTVRQRVRAGILALSVPSALLALSALSALSAPSVAAQTATPAPVRAASTGGATAAAPASPAPAGATAAPAAIDPHRRDDVSRHRTIAAAHEAAARCLESGQPEATCHDALRNACRGIAIGRWCGMKHVH